MLSQYDYIYTLDGNQVSKTAQDGKVNAYTYDDLGRLTNESETISGVTQSFGYTYDDNNNRATLAAAGSDAYTTAYTYDANNRLLTETKTTADSALTTIYYYDPNGNQISKSNESVSSVTGDESLELTEGIAGSEFYSYNGFNQLVDVSMDGIDATYAYAPSGLRVSKTVNGTQTGFVLDGNQVILELTGGAVTAKYVRGINLVMSTIGSDTNYYLYNGHGDVVQLVNPSGAVIKEYDYDAFGNEKDIDSADANPFRYCGEYYDLETKTYYLRARNYNPTPGRFLSEDTNRGKATDPLSLNLYTYCNNNPIFYRDSTGRSPETISKALDIAQQLAAYDGPLPVGDALATLFVVYAGGTYVYDHRVDIKNGIIAGANWIADRAGDAWNWASGLFASEETSSNSSGTSRAPTQSDPNSTYDQVDENGELRSHTTYNENGQPATRDDHTHYDKQTKTKYDQHRHTYTYNQNGQRNGEKVSQIP